MPANNLSLSFREKSLENVGRPATRIQFWKCSSWERSGRLSSVYPFGYFACQFGGGAILSTEYVGFLYFFDSPGQAIPLSDRLYVFDVPAGGLRSVKLLNVSVR